MAFNQAVVRWALRTYLGVADRGAGPRTSGVARTPEHVGRDEEQLITNAISADGGRRWLAALMRPEIVGIDVGGRLLHRVAPDPGR
jgi:hypothetical protein